jgi:phosphate-selective porin
MIKKTSIVLFFILIAVAPFLTGQSESDEKPEIRIKYGPKGWEFSTADGNWMLQLEWRLQFRYAHPRDTNPVTFDDFLGESQHIFKINRARLKVGGNAYRKWLKYYLEYELAASNLLDFRVMLERFPFLKLKIGQWKAQYSRERVISSGKQQMADRSLINRAFTLDRQVGLSLYGHLKGSGLVDFNYWASVFTGMGRGAKENDDNNLMWMLRGQWNFFGRELGFVGSDIEFHEKAAGLVALAAVTNRSPYTRFSSAGGGQLDGFEPGEPGQYRVNQALAETALKYRGFSWQQELHWKEVNDLKNKETTTLVGNYAQLGFFFNSIWEWYPKPLEIAIRHAIYNPDKEKPEDLQQEFSLALNWFFNGHRNKLTAEISHLDYQFNEEIFKERFRFRIQWDVSF